MKKILIVDDNPSHLENLKSAVANAGARIISATSGNEAIKQAAAESPDIILLDIVMDDTDGYGACRELRAAANTAETPIIFVTSKNNRADKIWAEKLGANALIVKPYTPEQIMEQVNRFL